MPLTETVNLRLLLSIPAIVVKALKLGLKVLSCKSAMVPLCKMVEKI